MYPEGRHPLPPQLRKGRSEYSKKFWGPPESSTHTIDNIGAKSACGSKLEWPAT